MEDSLGIHTPFLEFPGRQLHGTGCQKMLAKSKRRKSERNGLKPLFISSKEISKSNAVSCFSFGIAVPGVAVPVGSLTNLTLLTILWVLLPPYLQNGNMQVRVKQKKYWQLFRSIDSEILAGWAGNNGRTKNYGNQTPVGEQKTSLKRNTTISLDWILAPFLKRTVS